MTELQQLSHDSFYNMDKYSQITIDYIEEVEDILGEQLSGQEVEDLLGVLSYKISTVLDIINPALETDKEAFTKLLNIINEKLPITNYDIRTN